MICPNQYSVQIGQRQNWPKHGHDNWHQLFFHKPNFHLKNAVIKSLPSSKAKQEVSVKQN